MFDSSYKTLYLKLYQVVQNCLTDLKQIDKAAVHGVIEEVVQAFKADLYNDLLLCFYNQSDDHYLVTHITNNVILAVGFAESLSLSHDYLFDVGCCAFGHDFGMAEYLPLFQKTGELNEEESRMIKTHPSKSVEIFKSIFSESVLQAMLDVHEQVDGGGYPSGKSSVEISAQAKLVAVCDVFEALTHARNFRNEINPYEAMKFIIKKKNVVFDGVVINRFVDFMSIYPIGSMVLLNTNEVAMVVASNYGSPTRSLVKVVLDVHRQPDDENKVYDLLQNRMVYVVEALGSDQVKELSDVLQPWGSIHV